MSKCTSLGFVSCLMSVPIILIILHSSGSTRISSEMSATTIDQKLDRLFYNMSGVNGNPRTIAQKVLTSLIRFGYLSHDLLARASSTNRQLVEMLDVSTMQRALSQYQRKMRLPISGLIDGPTLHEQTIPRCGNKDLDRPVRPLGSLSRFRRYELHRDGVDKWTKINLTYSIMNYPSQSLTTHRVRRVLRRAVNAWARESGLYFREIVNDARADIRFKFKKRKHGDGISFDGPDGILAHAFYPKSGSLTGEVHFDDDENWTDGTMEGKNLLGVAVHELGHALGLAHSKLDTAIMFGIFIGYQQYFTLHDDDIRGIQTLYGPPQRNKVLEGDEDYYTAPPFVPTTPAPTPLKPDAPHVCKTPVSAVLSLHGYETQIFYKRFFWRVTRSETGDGYSTYELKDSPRLFNVYWRGLPHYLDRVDAAYQRTSDKTLMFFRGNRFWILRDNINLIPGFPAEGKVLQEIGLPHTVEKVDALFQWGYVPTYLNPDTYTKRIFLFAGDLYWEYLETMGEHGKVDGRRYPIRITSTWVNLPTPIDSAFTHVDGRTYFFKDYHFYAFNNRLMKVHEGYPKRSKLPWLGCTVNLMLRSRFYL